MKVNLKILKNICTLDEDKLKNHLKVVRPNLKDHGTYLYSESPDAKVLAVAHMDVHNVLGAQFRLVKDENTTVILHPSLDDRLGIFAILYLFPQYGIATDILLTTDEECCVSTASEFVNDCKKDYNWIVELDRAGEDFVMYNYDDDKEIIHDLKSVGFQLGLGSYSDICEMEELGVSAFNMGIGYHFQHTPQCCVILRELARQLRKLKNFYDEFKDKAYAHVYDPATAYSRFGGIYYPSSRDFYDDDDHLYGMGRDREGEEDEYDGADVYWKNGKMHWSYVAPRKASCGQSRDRRLWSGNWGENEAEY
jgi:hypothetical protein